MKRKKIIIISISLVITIIFAIFGGFLGLILSRNTQLNTIDFSEITGSSKKVVLFIGDGMGVNHVKATSSYYEKQMFMTSLEYQGMVSTFSNSLFSPTDSAAAASSLATGRKFNNKEVSRHNGIDITTISEKAKNKGLGVGIVTTDNLYGATPASFSSHANNRGDTKQIVLAQAKSNIDLFLGAGKTTYEAYKNLFENNGYNYKNDLSLFENNFEKQIGVFNNIVAENGDNISPTLEMLTEYAITYLEANYPNGYFLMIEGAHIDKASHSNNIFKMMSYLNSFDESIKICHDKLQTQANVTIMVTADHETGGLNYNNQTKDEINNSLYTRSGHSSKNVPYFIYQKTESTIKLNSVLKNKIDNTDIFKLSEALLNLK